MKRLFTLFFLVLVHSQSLNEDPMTALFEWGSKNKVVFSNVQVSSNPMSNFEATADIPPDKLLISVPYSFVINTGLNPNSDYKSMCDAIIATISQPASISDHICRAVYLAKSPDVNVFYKNAFPLDLRMVPIFYEKQDSDLLIGSMFQNAIQDRDTQITAEYMAVTAISDYSDLSEKDYRYFRTIENMKNMQIDINGQIETILCPVGDNLVLSENPNAAYKYNKTTNAVEFTSIRGIKKGEILSIGSGVKSQFKSLMAYGITRNVFKDSDHYFRLDQVLPGGKEVSLYLNWEFSPEDVVYQATQVSGLPEVKENIKFVFEALKEQSVVYKKEDLSSRIKDGSLPTNPRNIYRVLYEEQLVPL